MASCPKCGRQKLRKYTCPKCGPVASRIATKERIDAAMIAISNKAQQQKEGA